jgi:2-polyprenyl-3-methyl-5-hydroxy-6-metoxy-1,4-benzoquinol methylase
MKRQEGLSAIIANSQVLDIGCGTGSLLETLVIPPSTIHEPPIRSSKASTSSSSSSSVEVEDEDEDRELFILVRPSSSS